jgi:hypothetical protein
MHDSKTNGAGAIRQQGQNLFFKLDPMSPLMLRSAISAFTRVFDALWFAA